jgi:hypothetical protein
MRARPYELHSPLSVPRCQITAQAEDTAVLAAHRVLVALDPAAHPFPVPAPSTLEEQPGKNNRPRQ